MRSCFWPDPAKDDALTQACKQIGGKFIDISALSKDEGIMPDQSEQLRTPGLPGIRVTVECARLPTLAEMMK